MSQDNDRSDKTADQNIGENVRIAHPQITLQVRQPDDGALPTDDSDGEIDDLGVTAPEMYRLERMSETAVWSAVHLPDGQRLVINFFVKDGRLCMTDWIE